jgi:hypothetical protein
VSDGICTCGRPLITRLGLCCGLGCGLAPGSCECDPVPGSVGEAADVDDFGGYLAALGVPASDESLGAKKAKEAKKAPPDVPVAASEVYAGILGEITMAAEPGTEADPVGVLGSLLTMTSVAVGIVPHVQVGNDRHPLLVWSLLFGRTGSGRKGGATQTAALFIREACPDYASYATSGLSSGEGLIERIRDDGGKDEPGVADKRLLAVETEFGTVMARAARDGSTLAEVCRQAWNGEALSVLNRKRLAASWSHVGIIGHIAPADFRRRLAADLAAGTYNWYLPLYVERSKRLPIPRAPTRRPSTASAASCATRSPRRGR